MRSTARFRRAAAVLFLSLCAAAAGVPAGGLRALVLSRSLSPDASASTAYPFNPWADPVHPPVPGLLPLPPVPPPTVPTPTAAPTGSVPPVYPPYPPYLGGYQYGVPANVYAAYYRAAATMRGRDAGCHLSWAMLAGIGKIESGHARGGDLYADGSSRNRIIGIALDGSRSGTAVISDSDNGLWDGDTVWDHAVGPMQFLPGTWRRFGQDGNGDGRRDPHNMYDAALAAAAYLCAGGRDLATGAGLRAAIYAYNPSSSYVEAVLAWIAVYRQSGVPVPAQPGPSTPPPTHGTSPTPTPTSGGTSTHSPTAAPTTGVPTATLTPTPTVGGTPAPTVTATPTPTVSATPTSAPTDVTSPSETACPTATATATETAGPSATPTGCPTECPTGTPTAPDSTPTDTASPSVAPSDQPSAAPSCPVASEPADSTGSAMPSDEPAPAPSGGSTESGGTTGDTSGDTGSSTDGSEPAATPAKDENPLAREEEPAATPVAATSSSADSGRQSPTPTAPPDPADATAQISIETIGSGTTDAELVGTLTVAPVRDGWQVSVDHLHGIGGTVRYLDQLAPRVKESIATQYGAGTDHAVALVAVLDEDVVTALREVRRTSDDPTSAAASEARIAFGRVAAAAGLSARDVDYLIAAVS